MNTALVLTANNRPDYLEETLDSWRKVADIDSVDKHMFLEPSPFKDIMLEVVRDSDLDITVHENISKNGVLHNPWVALDFAFSGLSADFAILAEDDLVVSRDILKYFKAACSMYSSDEALGICSHSTSSSGDPSLSYLKRTFEVWIWGTWQKSWFDHIRDTWDHNYSTHNGNPGNEAGWDWNLSRLTKKIKPFVHSAVSRSQNIGKYRGTHALPDFFDLTLSKSFDPDRNTETFYR